MTEENNKQIDIIATGVAKLHESFDAVNKRLDQHDQLFVKIVDRLDSLDTTVKDINITVKSIVQMQASTDRELIDHDKRISFLEKSN